MRVVIKKNRRYVGLGEFREGEVKEIPDDIARQLIGQGFAEEDVPSRDEKVGRRSTGSRRPRKHDRHVKDAIGIRDK